MILSLSTWPKPVVGKSGFAYEYRYSGWYLGRPAFRVLSHHLVFTPLACSCGDFQYVPWFTWHIRIEFAMSSMSPLSPFLVVSTYPSLSSLPRYALILSASLITMDIWTLFSTLAVSGCSIPTYLFYYLMCIVWLLEVQNLVGSSMMIPIVILTSSFSFRRPSYAMVPPFWDCYPIVHSPFRQMVAIGVYVTHIQQTCSNWTACTAGLVMITGCASQTTIGSSFLIFAYIGVGSRCLVEYHIMESYGHLLVMMMMLDGLWLLGICIV